MTIPPEIREFWNAFESHVGGNVSNRFYEVCIFDDNASWYLEHDETRACLAELAIPADELLARRANSPP